MTFHGGATADALWSRFRGLALLNEEHLPPGTGFALHAPESMNVLTYVREGTLLNQTHSGRTGTLDAGEFHCMRLGLGVKRRAVNGSLTHRTHVFQCGLVPPGNPPKPADEQRRFSVAERRGAFRLVAARARRKAALALDQDVLVYSSVIEPGTHLIHELGKDRGAWLQVVEGRVGAGQHFLSAGDGAGYEAEAAVSLTALQASEVLLFDLG